MYSRVCLSAGSSPYPRLQVHTASFLVFLRIALLPYLSIAAILAQPSLGVSSYPCIQPFIVPLSVASRDPPRSRRLAIISAHLSASASSPLQHVVLLARYLALVFPCRYFFFPIFARDRTITTHHRRQSSPASSCKSAKYKSCMYI